MDDTGSWKKKKEKITNKKTESCISVYGLEVSVGEGLIREQMPS